MFPPPYWPPTKKSLVPENLIDQNKFELVFDEVEDGPALSRLLDFDNGGASNFSSVLICLKSSSGTYL